MSEQATKAKPIETVVVFVKGETKEENRWITLFTTFEKDGRTFSYRDKKTTDEMWNEAGQLLASGKAAIFRNKPKTSNGETSAETSSEFAPF